MIFKDYKKYFLTDVAVSFDQQPIPIAGQKTRRWRCYRYSFKGFVCGFFCILLLAGCDKFVEIPPPTTEITTATVFSNTGTVTSALTSIYTQMFNNAESYLMAQDQGLLSDELTNHSVNTPNIEFYTNAMLASQGPGDWNQAYYYIYEANAIIAGLTSNSNITGAVNQQLAGEAKFVRAFWHFYLTNLYGAVPIVTTTNYATNGVIYRSAPALVYSQIIQDLTDAVSLLNANYVDVTDTAVTTERTRPNKAAAEALLARAYLYTQKYDSAVQEATLVINNSEYGLCGLGGTVDSPFLANSTEAIWQLATPSPSSFRTPDGEYFTLVNAPGTGTYNCNTISPELMNAFEAGDQRKSKWIGSYTTPSPAVTYYFPRKYYSFNNTPPTEYTMVLRLAEQFLIRAEAEANLGDMGDATADLNVVRARAGLGASTILTANSTLPEADTALLHERQVELFTEWGNRWFDLIRTGVVNSVMGTPGGVCAAKGGVWNVDDILYPISVNEIESDPHLTQNPGY